MFSQEMCRVERFRWTKRIHVLFCSLHCFPADNCCVLNEYAANDLVMEGYGPLRKRQIKFFKASVAEACQATEYQSGHQSTAHVQLITSAAELECSKHRQTVKACQC